MRNQNNGQPKNLNLRGGFAPGMPGFSRPNIKTATSGQRPPELRKTDPILGQDFKDSTVNQNRRTQTSGKGNRRKSKDKTATGTQPGMGNSLMVYVNPIFSETPSSSENFNSDEPNNSRNGLFPERRSGQLTFDYGGKLPITNMQLEDNYTRIQTAVDGSSRNQIQKLTWNTSSYSENFLDAVPAVGIPQTTWSRQLKIIYERYSRDIVSNIRSKIVDSWSENNFKTYLKACCDLLEYFYCVDSILSYEGSLDNPDRNPILMTMKQDMSDFSILKIHDDARRILKNCWFPDKFSALIAWTFQNYKTGPGHQCSNYRYFCHNSLYRYASVTFDPAAVVAEYQYRIDQVTGTPPSGPPNLNNRNIISLLSQTYPDGIINSLPLSCSESVYDEKHFEAYVNQGILWPYNFDDPTDDPYGNMTTSFIGYPFEQSGTDNLEYTLYCSRRNPEDCTAFPFVLNSTYNLQLRKFTDGALLPICFGRKQNGDLIPDFDAEYITNKYYAWTPTQGVDDYATYARNWREFSYITPCNDVHTMIQDHSGTNPTTNFTSGSGCNSMAKGDFQNFYFNTSEARRIVMRDFLNSLFYLK